MKALIAYGTKYGATARASEEIGRILRERGFEVKVVDLKAEKIRDISEYDLIAIGSGVTCGRWVNEAEDFLKEFSKEFGNKRLALFVSSLNPISEKEGNTEEVAKTRKIALEDRISKYGLRPVSMGVFGGIIDFNRMGFITRKGMEAAFKAPLQKHGFKETAPGAYDLHDWDEIRMWAEGLARKSQE